MKPSRLLVFAVLAVALPFGTSVHADGIAEKNKACGPGEVGVKKGNVRYCEEIKVPASEKKRKGNKCAPGETYVQKGIEKQCVKPTRSNAEAISNKETKKRKKKAKEEERKEKKKQKDNLEVEERAL